MGSSTSHFGRHRALFYSHDTVGLGHLRRTLLLCAGLGTEFDDLAIMVVTGSSMAHGFRIPPGVDYVKLPCVSKVENEQYESRSLPLPFEVTFRMREQLILQTAINYRPDFFFVDNVPLGMKGEILKTLEYLREESPQTRIFLGIRDILDDSAVVKPLWRQLGIFDVLERLYDCICVYGLPEVFDPLTEYQWPESIRRKTVFCGYIPRQVDRTASRAVRARLCRPGERLIFVTVGGGVDGGSVVDSYLQALPAITRQERIASLILLGPDMHPDQARSLAAKTPKGSRTTLLDFSNDPLPYMDAADLVISMAGYNTISEILALKKKAIVVPRVQPRTEQLIRSIRLQQLGFIRMIHPTRLEPNLLAKEVLSSLRSQSPEAAMTIEFTGIQKLGHAMRSFLPVAAYETGGMAK